MKQLFLMVKDGSIQLLDTPAPTVKDSTVIVETLYSVVSAGTERSLTSFGGKNLLQKAMERPDQVRKVTEKLSTDGIVTTLESAFNRLSEPMPMGYSGVGRVVECGRGVTDVKKGDRVAMVGQAYHSEVNRVGRNLIAPIPEEAGDCREYAFAALAGIALEGIHQAEVTPGETAAVIGMGLLGHITARILDAYGCDVIGYDIADKTLPGTRLKAFIRSDDDSAAEMTRSCTGGRGADRVIITAAADSNAPVDLAAAIARDRGVICMIGVTQMNLDRRPFYERELTFKIARSYGPGRYDPSYEENGVDYPLGYVRFTEGRNVEEFVRLVSGGRLVLSDLITHVFAFEKAGEAYELITANKKKEPYIGVLLQYGENRKKWEPEVCSGSGAGKIRRNKGASGSRISIGLIGAGSFVRSTMLPAMKAMDRFTFRGLATTGGVSAAQTNEMFHFAYMTNDYRRLLGDEDIDLIIVSTRHNSHARFVTEALRAGKHVYCEKPLCLTLKELEEIKSAYRESEGELFCGLNRRHAPMVHRIKDELKTREIPAVYEYLANAGYIPGQHWTQDEAQGGGRIIGEACHFVDVIQYLDGSKLADLKVTYASNPAYPNRDNACITLRFESGAIGNIIYTSMGSKKYPKEQLRVFSGGMVMELDNYLRLTRYGANKTGKTEMRQDKGFAAEYGYMWDVIKQQKSHDIEPVFHCHELLIQESGG
ncbi:bi-domain-containing oxidoreductase [Otoolea muris]|uniref:bi-domain-containing oxidoreductase n=1 Tax=Otoolea muris TaxID=2941515 RepID=UPI00203E6D27|nr:bi-domain-containing oxidoreductase [Otoolea muris]